MNTLSSENHFSKKFYYYAGLILFILLIIRLVANYFVPLMDSTEARYGEIAREMLSSHNWITLLHNNGEPFLAKPPLSTWLSAISMHFFGINEFAARLPSLLLSIGILGLLWDLVKKQRDSVTATITVLFLAGGVYFYLDAGAVMTDASLVFSMTLGLVAFWHSMSRQSKIWSYVFFVALGLGLLAKGPIATVLTTLPLFAWVALRRQWKNLWLNFPWIKGSLISLAIALPWYVVAESRTPGFLNYFIIGEHFNRFFIPSWTGNKYGFSHAKPYGMIWVYTVLGLFPWSMVAAYGLVYHRKRMGRLCQEDNGWLSFLVLWSLLPLVFFTFSSNIIYPYVFPSLPAFALLFAELWKRHGILEQSAIKIISLALITGFGFLILTIAIALKPEWVAKSHKPVIYAWKAQKPQASSKLIYWASVLDYSAQFYSEGRAIMTRDLDYLADLLKKNPDSYIVVGANEAIQIPITLLMHLSKAGYFEMGTHKKLLLRNDK